MSARNLSTTELLMAGGLAISCALIAVVALVSFTKPAHFDARLATVERNADLISELSHQQNDPRSFPVTAICSPALAAEAQKLKAALSGQAAVAHLEQVDIDIAPQAAAHPGDTLVPINLRITASGQFGAAVGFLSQLSALHPLVFIDTVDLSSKTSFVTLALSGRVFCSAPR